MSKNTTPPAKQRPKGKATWYAHIDNWLSGNTSQPAYCRTQSLSYSSFVYWRMHYLKDNKRKPRHGFHKAVLTHDKPPIAERSNGHFKLLLPNGAAIVTHGEMTTPQWQALLWHVNGFVLIGKRLEKGTFKVRQQGHPVLITQQQLMWLLAGLEYDVMARFSGMRLTIIIDITGKTACHTKRFLLHHIQAYDVAYADETPVQVLNEPERAASAKSYMWLVGGGPLTQLAWVYHYSPTRGHEVPVSLLSGFSGYLHCDGFSAYDTLANKHVGLQQVGCWYPVRRKFVEADKISKKSRLARHALQVIGQLSQIEKAAKAKKLKPAGLKSLRWQKAKPIIDKFKVWLDKHTSTVPPESVLGKAMRYTQNQ